MKKVVIPKTNLRTSRLGFGTASLHHLFRPSDRRALLGTALDAGLSHFDTAPMYGEGIAERELGRFLGSARQRVTIATKIGFPTIAAFEHFPPLLYAHRALGPIGRRVVPGLWNYRPRSLTRSSVEQSLTRSLNALRTDWIDLLLVHEPEDKDIEPLLRLTEWLQSQKVGGRVRYLGLAGSVSNCLEVARQTPGLFDILQVEDSLAATEADAVIAAGWPLQITFGYLRGVAVAQVELDASDVIKAALARNREGMVLVSSRDPIRVNILASLAESDGGRL